MIYTDNTAIQAVNQGRDVPDAFYHPKHPSLLIATSRYKRVDGWRGYSEIVPEPGYKLLDSDFVVDDWGDAIAEAHGTTPTELRLQALEQEHRDLFVILTPTSNVFSTSIDVLVPDPDSARANNGKLIGHKTRRYDYSNGDFAVRYHKTWVVKYRHATRSYRLDTGGWNTITTAKRMTEALPDGWYVYRKNWVMYLHRPGRDDVALKDGMEVKS